MAESADAAGRQAAEPGETADGRSIEGVFSYHLQILANISTRIALLSIRPKFGLNIMQWRALANLDRMGESTVQRVARASGVLISQMSRTISELVGRGLVEKRRNPADARSRTVALTPAGRALVAEVLDDRRAINEAMLADLDADERRQLLHLMTRVERSSRDLYTRMRREAGGEVVFDL